MKKLLLLVSVLFLVCSSGYSEETPAYTPYDPSEFPGWARDLRRFEIVFFGTVPFSFFYATTGYSVYTYAAHNWDSAYAPALLGNRTPPVLTNSEKLQIAGISLSLSAAAAVVDYIIGKIQRD